MLLANELNSLLATMKPTDSLQIANEKVRKRLHELARDYYRTTLEELNEQLELHDYDLESYIPENKEYLAKLKKEFQGTIIKPHRLKMAGTMLEKSYPEAANSLECKEAFMKMLLRGEIEANRIYLAKLEADFANLKVQDDLFAGIDVDVIRPIPDLVGGRLVYPAAQESAVSPTLETLEQAIAHYVAYKASLNTDAKTGKDIEHALKLIRFVMPDLTHVGDLTKAKINEFEAKIAHIPTNFTKIEDLKKLDYAQLVQVSKTYPRISASTHDKYRVTVRAFLKWCIDTERLPNMVLPKWVGKDKQLAKDKRFPFTTFIACLDPEGSPVSVWFRVSDLATYEITRRGGTRIRFARPGRPIGYSGNYIYWITDRPLYLRTINIDLTVLNKSNDVKFNIHPNMFGFSIERYDHSAGRYRINVNKWLFYGQGIWVTWRKM